MSIDSYGMSVDEAKAKSTAWAVTYADLVTLLLTFFILLLVIPVSYTHLRAHET